MADVTEETTGEEVQERRRSITFDPGQHLSKVKGQDYLEVKWRLAWLRAEHPDAVLETNLESHDNGRAIFRARITLTDGSSATGYGSETVDTFENYIEKAETKAIGRASAALGYGTQFCDDFNDTGSIADAPVQLRGNRSGGGGAGDAAATSSQKSMIQYKARQANLEPEALVRFIREETGKEFAELTKRDASRVIDALGSAPAPRPAAQGSGYAPAPSNASPANVAPPAASSGGAGITPAQKDAILKITKRLKWDDRKVMDYVRATAAEDVETLDDLSKGGASDVITGLQEEK